MPDEIELELGSDPFNPDSDGDGLNDSQDPEPNTPNPVVSPEPTTSWIDITELVTVDKTTGVLNRILRKITSIATITNTPGQDFNGAIRIELVSSNLGLDSQSDGQLENGNHYWEIQAASDIFYVNEELGKQLNFNLSRARLNYEVRVHFKED